MARYLSHAELSCIAGKYIEMYYALFGISKNDPAPINPEQFANSVLGLNLKMLPGYLEHVSYIALRQWPVARSEQSIFRVQCTRIC